jgi:hypothetical protein
VAQVIHPAALASSEIQTPTDPSFKFLGVSDTFWVALMLLLETIRPTRVFSRRHLVFSGLGENPYVLSSQSISAQASSDLALVIVRCHQSQKRTERDSLPP